MHRSVSRGTARRSLSGGVPPEASRSDPLDIAPATAPRSDLPSLRVGRSVAALAAIALLGACAATPRFTATTNGATTNAAATNGATTDGAATAETSADVVVRESAVPSAGAALPATDASASTARSPTLYAELGGAPGVDALIERFIREIAADERIRGHYRDTDIGRFERMLQQQMCARAGGGCRYTGDDMRRTHGGMNITPTEFNAIVEALMRAMDGVGLPVATQNRLLALYAPMRADIIDL